MTATIASAQSAAGVAQPTPLSGRTTPGGSVTAVETPVAGVTGSVSTVNPVIQVQGAFGGSTRGAKAPLVGPLSLQEALRRGMEYNLGVLNLSAVITQARGQRSL